MTGRTGFGAGGLSAKAQTLGLAADGEGLRILKKQLPDLETVADQLPKLIRTTIRSSTLTAPSWLTACRSGSTRDASC